MECNIVKCEKTANNFYMVAAVKFGYCDGHKYIPEKIINNFKNGAYMSYGERREL